MTKIKSIEAELADCRAAFAADPEARFVWCCHHEILIELLTETPEARITYILKNKEKSEQATRFRNFRPVRIKLPKACVEARKACVEARKACVEAGKALVEAGKTLVEAGKACVEAGKAYVEAGKACVEAGKAYVEVFSAARLELEKLHHSDWPDNSWNGKSIFERDGFYTVS